MCAYAYVTPQAGEVTRIKYGEPHAVFDYTAVDLNETFNFQYTIL